MNEWINLFASQKNNNQSSRNAENDDFVRLLVSWVTIIQIQVTILATLFHSQEGQPSWVHIVATLFDDDYDEIAYFRQFKKSPS